MKNLISVSGPTASGKSSLSLGLCEKFSCELVSFDSMQIYRKMDIGTAKPTKEEMQRVRHHLVDICDANEKFSAAEFVAKAKDAVGDIHSRGKAAVLCGGTGLYLDSFLSGRDFGELSSDEALRRELFEYAEKNGNAALHKILFELDPVAAQAIHENNVKRVVRAIEICKTSGMTKTEWDKKAESANSPLDCLSFILDFRNRDVLYERIDKRVDQMVESGLIEETEMLLRSGALDKGNTAAQAIGYKEIVPYLHGEASLDDAVLQLKTSTRHYAKRQLTWLRSKPGIRLFVDDYSSSAHLLEEASSIVMSGGDPIE